MCGIVGYIGKNNAVPILIEGLKKLEYRGYDSAGAAVLGDKGIVVAKEVGKIKALEQHIDELPKESKIGIAHTRWATHGEPSRLNAHPHTDSNKRIALVHNGIIENYQSLRTLLEKDGAKFETETDTEVLAFLFAKYYKGNLLEAVRKGLTHVQGTYGVAVIAEGKTDEIVAARQGSPIVIGTGDGEMFVASDVSAMLRHTNKVVYLEDNEIVSLRKDSFKIVTIENDKVSRDVEQISWDLSMIEKHGYAHYMLKEIFEQPKALRNAIRGRLDYENGTARLDGLKKVQNILPSLDRFIMLACGTSWHSGLIGEYLLEELSHIPVETEYASEFRYRSPIIRGNTVAFVISQSGETADTKAALEEAARKGAMVLGICNVVGSTIARKTEAGVYIHAGAEIGVASTKAFTSQVMVLTLIALMVGRMRNISVLKGRQIVEQIEKIPDTVQKTLDSVKEAAERLAKQYKNARNFLYLGRGYNFPVALEGALKLKEISYIHAEGYPAAEMKHGPIALIDEQMPVVFIANKDGSYDKIISNIQEVKARRGKVIAIANEGDTEISKLADHVIYVPQVPHYLSPIINIIPLQLLAYYIALEKGCDVDQPRNLAKSVTVE